MECGPSLGRGRVIETLASPLPSALEGVPLRVPPPEGSSSLNVMPSFEAKPVSDPVKVASSSPLPKKASPSVLWSSVRLAAPIVTVPLLVLSSPRQLSPLSGVIVYCQLPKGTPYSVQVSAVIVPLQPACVSCGAYGGVAS